MTEFEDMKTFSIYVWFIYYRADGHGRQSPQQLANHLKPFVSNFQTLISQSVTSYCTNIIPTYMYVCFL